MQDFIFDENSNNGKELLISIKNIAKNNIVRPNWEYYFMSIAWLLSTRSACHRLQVGCVLVSSEKQKNRILASGYNGFLPGSPHLSRIRIDSDGKEHEQSTVHAEQNAIADAAKRGVSVENSTAYVTHFPCIHCSKILASAGIKLIYFCEDYHNDPIAKILLKEANIEIKKLDV